MAVENPNLLRGHLSPSTGNILIPEHTRFGYVEQTIQDLQELSGGQRLNKKLSQALAASPDVLLLDETTNHLDRENRKSLIRMLSRYQGTLILVTHDQEILRNCSNTLWHIEGQKIHLFSGSYEDYRREQQMKRTSLENDLSHLKRERKATHDTLMQEQKRAAQSKTKGQKSIEQRKWPPIVSQAKALRGEKTSGKKRSAIDHKKSELIDQLDTLRLPEIVRPTFSISLDKIVSGTLLSISNADIGYGENQIILKHVNLSLGGRERIALYGRNASGKTTLLKAIMNHGDIFKTGTWQLPTPQSIGYLDQHYANLDPMLSTLDHLRNLKPEWDEGQLRRHLNDFLFRKNDEVARPVSALSGGERARASLSLIAAQTPRLLVLDEITNNLDLETKEHVIQVLQDYPGAMLIVSHEEDFVHTLKVNRIYTIERGTLM